MKIITIQCLEDNYSYLLIDEFTKEVALIDPVDPEKLLKEVYFLGMIPKLILTTHHHWDHAGGNEKIKKMVPGIKVYGGSIDNVSGCTDKLEHGDKFSLSVNVNILALHTPGHTKGHICYYVTCDGKGEDGPVVFTGDTLFIAGCGKFFEGTAEQMYQSLCVTLGSLPKITQVYCGHEYTVKNLEFARTIEPDNDKLKLRVHKAAMQRLDLFTHKGFTVPSTIGEEMEFNPFMRVDLPEIQEKVNCKTPIEALRVLRERKNNWAG